MRKRSYLSLLLILSLLLSLCVVPASAAEAWDTNPMTGEQVAALDIPYFEQPDGTIALGISDSETTGSYKGGAASLNLPSSIDGKRVTRIAKCAFYAAKTLTSVVLPNSLLEIGDNAFGSSGLTSVVIPDGVTSIGSRAFGSCNSLSHVVIPASVSSTGAWNNGPFVYCDSLTSAGPIGSGCSIEFGWTDTIPAYAFFQCTGLKSAILPDGLKVIPVQLFELCDLRSVTIPETVTTIEAYAFDRNYNLGPALTLPASCTVLNNGCFKDCRALETVTIQGAAKATGYYLPFTFCTNLRTIYLETCLADKKWQDSTGAEPAEVIWSHKIISEWSPWAKTHLAKDENGNSLWNGHYRHYRTATCVDCGTAYEFESCSFIFPDSWSPNGASNHIKRGVCSICSETNVEFETHSSFGDWVSISKTQHSRQVDCDVCGYSGSETAQHSFQYGAWSDYSDIQHQRQVTCSECDYVGAQLAVHSDQGNDGLCDACGHLMSRFSVTVPATLNLTVAKNGTVYAATSAQIVNNSTGAVCVTSVELTAENGWQLVPYSTNMADEKVDAKRIGFALNGAKSDGTATLPMSGSWDIAKDGALSLDYDAVVSATSTPINEQVLTVVFVLDWAA